MICAEKTNLQLAQDLYQHLNKQFFASQLPLCTLEFSKRMKHTAAKIWPSKRLLRLSLAYHEYYGVEELNNTLLHEMVHLWLYEQGLPSGHTILFRQKMREFNISDRIHALPMPPTPYKYLYGCPTCHREIRTRRLIKGSCGTCDKVYNIKHRFKLLKNLTA